MTRHDPDLPAGWVEVSWNNGSSNTYRLGSEGKYDLKVVEMRSPGPSTSISTQQGSSTNREDTPLVATSQDGPSPGPGEEPASTDQERPSEPDEEGSSEAAERGSAEQDDSKVEVLAPVEEATGDPLVRIPSGAVTREARDVDAGTDVAQADQPGEPTAESSTGNTETTTLVVNVGSSAR